MFLHILSALLIGSGLLFFLGASIGLLRFPDFYTRMHAAGKGDTLSTLLIMAGAAVYLLSKIDLGGGNLVVVLLVVVKIMAIGGFIMLTSPTSTHALMQAGYDDDIEPVGERDEMRLEMPELGVPKKADAETTEPEAVVEPAKKKNPPRKEATTTKKSAAKKAVSRKSAAKKKSTGGRKKD